MKPVKGDAVLFYNLKPDAVPDPLSLHASCPVIKGKKWVATKWVRLGSFDSIPAASGAEETDTDIIDPESSIDGRNSESVASGHESVEEQELWLACLTYFIFFIISIGHFSNFACHIKDLLVMAMFFLLNYNLCYRVVYVFYKVIDCVSMLSIESPEEPHKTDLLFNYHAEILRQAVIYWSSLIYYFYLCCRLSPAVLCSKKSEQYRNIVNR